MKKKEDFLRALVSKLQIGFLLELQTQWSIITELAGIRGKDLSYLNEEQRYHEQNKFLCFYPNSYPVKLSYTELLVRVHRAVSAEFFAKKQEVLNRINLFFLLEGKLKINNLVLVS